MSSPKSHASGTGYPSQADVPLWAVDRGRVLAALDQLVESSAKAADEIAAQGTTVTVIKTRLDERTHDIEDLRRDISRLRDEHASTVARQAQISTDLERVTDDLREVKKRSIMALGGGGALGGGAALGILELLRSLLSSGVM